MKKIIAGFIAVLLLTAFTAFADWDVYFESSESQRYTPIEMKLVPADDPEGEPVISITVNTGDGCTYDTVIEDDSTEPWFIGDENGYSWDVTDETPWLVTKDGRDYIWVIDDLLDAVVAHVVSLPEDDENGEIAITVIKDYCWDISIVRDDGADATFTLNVCPDLGWGWNADMIARYCDKQTVIDRDIAGFSASFFVPFSWVFDQTQPWYLWATDARLNGLKLDFKVDSYIEPETGVLPEDPDTRGAITIYVHKLVLD